MQVSPSQRPAELPEGVSDDTGPSMDRLATFSAEFSTLRARARAGCRINVNEWYDPGTAT